MTVNSRAKGRAAEQAAARWLTENGWPTKRRLAGNGQAGDLMIADAPDVVVDVKARKQLAIPSWLDQLVVEADGREHMALLVKVEGEADPAGWLAVAAGYWATGPVVPPPLDKRTTTDLLGWLRVQRDHVDCYPFALVLDGERDWLVMLAETWRAQWLPTAVAL